MERLSVFATHLIPKPVVRKFVIDQFEDIQLAPPDPILGTALAWKADKDAKKMNLGVGAYRTDDEKPYVFNVVKKVEKEIIADTTLNKEYATIDGLPEFTSAAQKLLFGEGTSAAAEGRIVSTQTLSGTGSLRIASEFFYLHRNAKIYMPKPTWGNHPAIFHAAGLKTAEYPYFKDKTKSLDFEGMMGGLAKAEPGSIILLHVCAHNPTGVDPTPDQWIEIAKLMKERDLFPFFDSAYQGFASGDLEKDAFSVRYFLKQGFQMLVCQSFAKNMGLYGERIGALHIVTKRKETAVKVLSQVKIIIRSSYSSPPLHGARIASKILNSKENFEEWRKELSGVAGRVLDMRAALHSELVALKVPGNWDHITSQIGMFSYTGLTAAQCEILINKYHIYLLKNGRISMTGVNSRNVKYLAQAIKDAIESTR